MKSLARLSSTLAMVAACFATNVASAGTISNATSAGTIWRDTASNEIINNCGNVLQDGDSVTVIKDLKVKGSSAVVKVGTKVKNIRLVDGDHDIDCKIDGIGAMGLKSEFVKKA